MLLLAGQSEANPGPFLLIWGLGVIVLGGIFASKKGAAGIRRLVVQGLEQNPEQQAKARAVPENRLRFIGGFLALCGVVAIPVSLFMMTGH
ncbi:hypothetical protein [Streptomyces sp. NPDC026673]|uniref:hypothetical protein n=1 Tax=Streptomyces sp. NPDC026673 TaxID=3155724 RepID=UPI0033CF3592